jgi:uncharacterized protein with WD repeat
MSERERQLKREKALFRYIGALERGDINTLAVILHEAESDPALERMILDHHAAQSAVNALAPVDRYPRSSNGHVKEEKDNMTMQTIAINPAFEYPTPARRRDFPHTLVAAVIALLFFGGLLMYTAGFLPAMPEPGAAPPVALTQAEETPEAHDDPPATAAPFISAANAGQIELIEVVERDFLTGAMAWSPDGELLALSHAEGILLYDTDTFTMPRMLEIERLIALKVFFSPDATLLGVVENSAVVRLYDVATGEELIAFEGHDNRVLDAAFSPDGTLLATASQDRTVRLWDVATGQEVRILEGHNSAVTSVVFSPDGTALASASGDVRLWDVESGRQIAIFSIRGMVVAAIGNLLFSPDGDVIVTTQGARIRLWDVASGNELLVIEDEESTRQPGKIVLSQDGSLLAVIRGDVVQLWDAGTGGLLGKLEGSERSVSAVAFSPDGTTLAFNVGIARGGGVWLWGIDSPDR